jgi:hypothetical protein
MAKRLGIGATCTSIGVRYLHPKRLLKERFLSTTPKQRLYGLLSLRKENKKKIEWKNQCCVVLCCVVFRHDYYPNIELFCQERSWCKVDQEDPENSLFDSSEEGDVTQLLVVLRISCSSEQQALMLMMTMEMIQQHLKTYQESKEKQYRTFRHGDGMVSVIESRQVLRTIQQER